MKIVTAPSPNKSSRSGHRPQLIVLHGDAGKTDAGTVSWLTNPESKVSYHWLVGRDGTAYKFVEEAENAWHAGVSQWEGLAVGKTINPVSIGVCFANDGLGAEPYRAVQYDVGAELVAAICRRHLIPVHRIVGHRQVSPGRKTDPWDWFDWERFTCALGKVARL
jgi:N-acetylmuramoyl-L-alanine amidase